MKKIVVGLSGGVDSSVAAYLLKKQGFEVVGVTSVMHEYTEETEDAKKIAQTLGIEHIIVDYKQEFKKNIIDDFCKQYIKAYTPNPCVRCNPLVKWKALLDTAAKVGADKIATGHYSDVIQLENGRYSLSVADYKDQTYALYGLSQEQLGATIMPICNYSKEEVRQMAGEIGLAVCNKPDSQDICFVTNNDYYSFLENNVPDGLHEPGDFVDKDGNILGRHKGIEHYTIGQRKGLELALGHPVFVTHIDVENNRVVIGENEDCFKERLIFKDVSCMAVSELEENKRLLAKIRYAHKGTYGKIKKIGEGMYSFDFEEPVRAVTPGQSIVFYEDNHVYGGGIIEE